MRAAAPAHPQRGAQLLTAERIARMKWLEGWFGTASGVLGAAWIALIALVTPSMQTSGSEVGQVCTTSSDGVTTCSTAYGPGAPPSTPGPNIGALILVGVCILLFIGVVVGTWLDLRGVRRMGRIILLTSATLLIFAPFGALGALGASGGGGGGFALAYTYPFVLLALITGVLASVRRDAPRSPAATSQAV